MLKKITNTPTNLVMGFLGVGKTTAILNLLKQKPKNENWAVLVNEFGEIGIDGAIYNAANVTVKEIAGGCLCCAVGLPFQASINRLLKEVKPDRLLIEPTGLGHPKKVLDMLTTGSFNEVLELRSSICLVDPEKFKDTCYTKHKTFIDQIALSDVLVANKIDLADHEALKLFHQWARNSRPVKALIAQTMQGQLDPAWLDMTINSQRQATYPNAHKITQFTPAANTNHSLSNKTDGYQSFGHIFPTKSCFDYNQLNFFLSQRKLERIKAILKTNKGWFIINGTGKNINFVPTSPSTSCQIEIITRQIYFQDFLSALNQCTI